MTVVMQTSTQKHDARHAQRASRTRGAESRARIVEAAARLFRAHGVDGVGVDAIMEAAGLTHGGFYTHFDSKEALAAEAAAAALTRSAARWQEIASEEDGRAALLRLVGNYLDPAHVAVPERGCALTSLGADIARREAARPGVTGAVRGMLGALQRCLPGGQREDAMAALSTMVGAVILARVSDDPALARQILDAAKTQLLTPS